MKKWLAITLLCILFIAGTACNTEKIDTQMSKEEIFSLCESQYTELSYLWDLCVKFNSQYAVVFYEDANQEIMVYTIDGSVGAAENKDYEEIGNKMKEIGVEQISIGQEGVNSFVFDISGQLEKGIYYSESGMNNMGSNEDEHIEGNWYYYEIAHT